MRVGADIVFGADGCGLNAMFAGLRKYFVHRGARKNAKKDTLASPFRVALNDFRVEVDGIGGKRRQAIDIEGNQTAKVVRRQKRKIEFSRQHFSHWHDDRGVIELARAMGCRVEGPRRLVFGAGKPLLVPVDDELRALRKSITPLQRNKRENFVGPPRPSLTDPAPDRRHVRIENVLDAHSRPRQLPAAALRMQSVSIETIGLTRNSGQT